MKCVYCGKEINEMTEKYHIYTLDGDFIHDECDTEELTELLKSYNDNFSDDEVLIVINKQLSRDLSYNVSLENIDYICIDDLTA